MARVIAIRPLIDDLFDGIRNTCHHPTQGKNRKSGEMAIAIPSRTFTFLSSSMWSIAMVVVDAETRTSASSLELGRIANPFDSATL